MVKPKEPSIDKVDNFWNAIAYFFKYIFIKHFWKVFAFFLLLGVMFSGFTFKAGNFFFQKTEIKTKKEAPKNGPIYNNND